jgi:hypothetical protein
VSTEEGIAPAMSLLHRISSEYEEDRPLVVSRSKLGFHCLSEFRTSIYHLLDAWRASIGLRVDMWSPALRADP